MMNRSTPFLGALLTLAGCASSPAPAPVVAYGSDARQCDLAVEEASLAWTSYATERRLEALRAWADGADELASAAATYAGRATEHARTTPTASARASAAAARQAAGDAGAAAEQAQNLVDDAIAEADDEGRFTAHQDFFAHQVESWYAEAMRAAERAAVAVHGTLDDANEPALLAGREATTTAGKALRLAEEADALGGHVTEDQDLTTDHPVHRRLTEAQDRTDRARVLCHG